MKRATEKEKDRFHNNYGSAREVKENFKRDLTSGPAKKIHRLEKDLGLPTIPDVKDDFFNLCEELKVN